MHITRETIGYRQPPGAVQDECGGIGAAERRKLLEELHLPAIPGVDARLQVGTRCGGGTFDEVDLHEIDATPGPHHPEFAPSRPAQHLAGLELPSVPTIEPTFTLDIRE